MKPNHKQRLSSILQKFGAIVTNRAGQNAVEYMLIFATVVGTVLVALGPSGFVTKSIERVPESTLENARCVALGTCFSESGECNPVCPNDCCEPGENYDNCPNDCPKPPEEERAYCGNGKREDGETCRNCPHDFYPNGCCGNGTCDIDLGEEETCPSDCTAPGEKTCPDGTCDPETEDYTTCPEDCPQPLPAPVPSSCGEKQMQCNGECIADNSIGSGGGCCVDINCVSGVCVDGLCQAPGKCLGSFANATICPEDGNPAIDTASRLVATCSGAECEFRCGSDYEHCNGVCYRNSTIEDNESCCNDVNCASGHCVDGNCVPTPGGCTGPVPGNAELCDGDESPTSTTPNRLVAACSEEDCEYTCVSQYSFCNAYANCVKDGSVPDYAACCDAINCDSGYCDPSKNICTPSGVICGNGVLERGEVCDGVDGLRDTGEGYWEGTNWYTEQDGDCAENCRGRFRTGSCGGKPENAYWYPNHTFVEYCNNGSGSECNNWKVVEDGEGNLIDGDTTPVYSEEDIEGRTCDYFCDSGTEYCQKGCIETNSLGKGSPCCQNSNCRSNQCGEDRDGNRVCVEPIPECIGTAPANTEMCPGDDTPDTNMDITLVERCGARDCEYECIYGTQYCDLTGGTCILDKSLPEGAVCCDDANCASDNCQDNSCQPEIRCLVCGTYYEKEQIMYTLEQCTGTSANPQPMRQTFACGSSIPVSNQPLSGPRKDLCAGLEGESKAPSNYTFEWNGYRVSVPYGTEINDACPLIDKNCGNMIVEKDRGEQCDDGNQRNGDGCDGSCQWEQETFDCWPVIENAEFNNVGSYVRTCRASTGASCSAWDLPKDNTTEYNPEPSDVTCRFDCVEGMFWNGSVCQEDEETEAFCSNGTVEDGEQCDDGNKTGGDGCSSICQWERKNFSCPLPAISGAGIKMNSVWAYSQKCAASDGTECTLWDPPDDPVTEYNEEASRTSCRFICQSGTGWTGSECSTTATCGDGNVDESNGEKCDDGNLENGDGCDARCQWESRIFSCPPLIDDEGTRYNTASAYVQKCVDSNGSTCIKWNPPIDSVVEYSEEPSSTSCQFTCESTYEYKGGTCQPLIVCGDGDVDGDEQCDDRNTRSGDGCSSDCKWESKVFLCPNFLEGGAAVKANTVYVYSQICKASDGTSCTSWNPPDDPVSEYNEEPSDSSCRYICNNGYEREGGKCVSSSCGNGIIDPAGCSEACTFSGSDPSCNSIDDQPVCDAMANCQWNVGVVITETYCQGFHADPISCMNEPYGKCLWDEKNGLCVSEPTAGSSFQTNSCGYIVQCDLVQSESECIGSSSCQWDDCTEECDGGVHCSNCKCTSGYHPTNPPSKSCTNVCSTQRNQWGQCCPAGKPVVTDCNGDKVCMPCSQPGETWSGDCGVIGPLSGMPGCKALLN